MFQSPWQPTDQTVALRFNQFAAVASLLRPWDGLANVTVAGQCFSDAKLFAIARDSDAADMRPIESYVRGDDLVTAYDEVGRSPVRVDALWRAVRPAETDKFLAAVDVVVSVRTTLLDSHPDVSVYSLIPSGETLQLENAERGVGCSLFRPTGVNLTYIEMVHPADFQQDELVPSKPDETRLRIAHRLFCTSLEKGVILRAHVRGVFLGRQDDHKVASQCYAAFAASDSPLGA